MASQFTNVLLWLVGVVWCAGHVAAGQGVGHSLSMMDHLSSYYVVPHCWEPIGPVAMLIMGLGPLPSPEETTNNNYHMRVCTYFVLVHTAGSSAIGGAAVTESV